MSFEDITPHPDRKRSGLSRPHPLAEAVTLRHKLAKASLWERRPAA
jgi:hypothetical protein